MNNYRINTNYAKALFMVATDTGNIERAKQDMVLVGEVMAENRQLRSVFANPTIRFDKKVGIVRELFGGEVSDEVMAFLVFVVKKNRSINLQGIADSFVEQYRVAKGIVLSDLVTHQPIDDEARRTVTQLVEEYTGKQCELHDRTDPKMLGGFKLEFDHNMYDARIRTKIRKLRLEFAKNDYESKL